MQLLNYSLLKHPLNWVIVTLMVVIGVFVINLVMTPWHLPSKSSLGVAPNFAPVDLQTTQ